MKVKKTKKYLKEIKSNLEDKGVKKYNPLRFMSFFSIDRYKEIFKNKFQSHKMYLIIMFKRNLKYSIFTITSSNKTFIYNGGEYFLDTDFGTDEVSTGLSAFFYHEDISTPFKIKHNIDDLITSVTKDDKGIALALNPNSLKGFIKSQVIEKVLKGQELSDDMAFMKKLIIINLLVSALVLFVVAKSLGWI